MSKKDQVSIFVPTFNSETTIVETIKSILDQSYENITITIIDNASIDKTVALVKTIKDKRLSIIQNKINIGAEENFNRCLSLSQKKSLLYFMQMIFTINFLLRSKLIFLKEIMMLD